MKLNKSFHSIPNRIIFDLDNTIYSYETAHRPAIEHLLIRFSQILHLSTESTVELWNASRKEVKRRLGDSGSSHSRLIYILEVLRRFHPGVDLKVALELEAAYWKVYFEEMKLYPNLHDFLQQVKLCNIEKILVTDLTAYIQIKKLVHLGLENFFDYVITSEEVGGDKITDKPWSLLNELCVGNAQGVDWYIGDSCFDFNKNYRNPTDSVFMKVDGDLDLESVGIGVTVFKNYSELIDCLGHR